MAIKKLKKTDVSYLIVNYNQEEELEPLIRNIKEKSKDLEYEILIFDNSGEVAQSRGYKVFSSSKNIGYGPAVNYLSTKATGKNLIVLNPDVEIVRPLSDAVFAYESSNIKNGIMGLGDAEKQYSVPLLVWLSNTRRFSGYAFIINKELFKITGGFSLDYFMYFEDSDLYEKLKEFKIFSSSTEFAYVKHKKTYKNLDFKKRKFYYYQSLLTFLRTHRRFAYYLFYFPVQVLIRLHNPSRT